MFSGVLSSLDEYIREEVTKIAVPSPGNGVPPARFGRLGNYLVVNLEGKIRLRLERLDGLRIIVIRRQGRQWYKILTALTGGNLARFGSVKTPTYV